jgi:hypothetical protein
MREKSSAAVSNGAYQDPLIARTAASSARSGVGPASV